MNNLKTTSSAAARPTRLARLAAVALLLGGATVGALAQYKIVGPDGKVTYTDKPPTAQDIRPSKGTAAPAGSGRHAVRDAPGDDEVPRHAVRHEELPELRPGAPGAAPARRAVQRVLGHHRMPTSPRSSRASAAPRSRCIAIGSQTIKGYSPPTCRATSTPPATRRKAAWPATAGRRPAPLAPPQRDAGHRVRRCGRTARRPPRRPPAPLLPPPQQERHPVLILTSHVRPAGPPARRRAPGRERPCAPARTRREVSLQPWRSPGCKLTPRCHRPPGALDEHSDAPGLLAAGGGLSIARLRDAYSHGVFPWYSPGQPVLWWSPDPRMLLRTDDFKLSHSLRKTLRRFLRTPGCELRFDHDTAPRDGPLRADAARRARTAPGSCPRCRPPTAPGPRAGDVHSVETWIDGELVGGLYGVNLGRMMFGESMFSHRTDASKIALAGLVAFCRCARHARHRLPAGHRPPGEPGRRAGPARRLRTPGACAGRARAGARLGL